MAASSSTSCSCSPNPPLPAAFAADQPESDLTPEQAALDAKWAALLQPSAGDSNTPAATASVAAPPPPTFDYDRHVKFFAMHLKSVPQGYESLDTSRMTLLYFCLSALDVLGAIESTIVTPGLAPQLIDWIYAHQVHPWVDPDTGEETIANCGFRGSTYIGVPFQPERTSGFSPALYPFDDAHIAMTYTALCSLRILGDDLSRVNRRAVIGALRHLQQADGSFSSTRIKSESDMRFLYCACVISAMLGDWSGFDVDRSVDFICASQSYDGGIGLWPGCEGHGGSTYCGVASLVIMKKFKRLPSTASLLKWCIANQGAGYRGRPGKDGDSCYSFWLGASLVLIGVELGIDITAEWTRKEENRHFNLKCQSKMGGFSKEPGCYPDLLHSYFGLCGLSIIGIEKQLEKIDCMIGVTIRAAGDQNSKR